MNISILKEKIEKAVSPKRIDWAKTEEYIRQLGDNINDIEDGDDSFLSNLYCYIRNGRDAVKLTELFLHYGYDVSANNGFNGAACLQRLCYSLGDHYILHVAEMLIDAGADCTLDIDEPSSIDDNDPPGVLSCIGWRLGDWMTGEFYYANIIEAYSQMVIRKTENKPYKGIRSFRDFVGKTVNKVLRLSWRDSNGTELPHNAFDGGLVLIADDAALVAQPYIEFVVNPYYLDENFIAEDVSDCYKEIIGTQIRGLRFESSTFATISFENGKRLSFMSAWYDSEKDHQACLCYLRSSNDMLKLHSGAVINELLFTVGRTFSDACRIHELSNFFFRISEKYYHVYSKGRSYGSHSLRIEEIPSEWAERLKLTVKDKDVTVESAKYVQDSLKWIELKTDNGYLYICVDTFEEMNFFKSKTKIENPLEDVWDKFDKNLEKIDYIHQN